MLLLCCDLLRILLTTYRIADALKFSSGSVRKTHSSHAMSLLLISTLLGSALTFDSSLKELVSCHLVSLSFDSSLKHLVYCYLVSLLLKLNG